MFRVTRLVELIEEERAGTGRGRKTKEGVVFPGESGTTSPVQVIGK